MSICGSPAKTKQDYLVDHDSSLPWDSNVIPLVFGYSAINWQFCWDSNVSGKFVWEASILENPYKWEPLVSCQEVELIVVEQAPLLSGIVSLPAIWLTVGFIRVRWIPNDGSSGLIQEAIRSVPL